MARNALDAFSSVREGSKTMTRELAKEEPEESVATLREPRVATSILHRVLQTTDSLPVWLRFVAVFAILLVVVVLSGKAVQAGLVPLLYLLLLIGAGGYLVLEFRHGKIERDSKVLEAPRDLSEDDWLELVIRRLTDCQAAYIYLRYFRDPDHGEDERLHNKRDKVREIMTMFSRLLLDHGDRFLLVAFRKRSWTDDPKQWLTHQIREIRPDISETKARSMVDDHVLVIHDEPQPNSSTIYLLDDRYLLFNRVTGDIGTENKKYHAQDFANSVMPALIRHGLEGLFRNGRSES
ncbi:MAG: hypothetical protein A2Y76_10645 [Planctomycetes bacterium RBG_13_60_9]|nr:MAG: hypothetical protein A2Y76_10645 [Planctomycetes bacterium RBG_13_60_9]